MTVQPVISLNDIFDAQAGGQIHVDEKIRDYIVKLVFASASQYGLDISTSSSSAPPARDHQPHARRQGGGRAGGQGIRDQDIKASADVLSIRHSHLRSRGRGRDDGRDCKGTNAIAVP
jgi:hypothetical protein